VRYLGEFKYLKHITEISKDGKLLTNTLSPPANTSLADSEKRVVIQFILVPAPTTKRKREDKEGNQPQKKIKSLPTTHLANEQYFSQH